MIGIVFLLGLAMGSFLNAYIWRMRSNGSVWQGRSYCPKCKKGLAWYELIPLISFFVQLGRCRGCNQKIDWQYPLVELVTGILFVLAYTKIGSPKMSEIQSSDVSVFIFAAYLFSALVVLFVYDLRYGLVPDRVVLPAIGVTTLYTVIASPRTRAELGAGFYSATQSPEIATAFGLAMTLGWTLIAIVVGAGFFWLQYRVSRGRWLGAGDIRIGALMGAFLGWPQVLVALVVSYLIGGLVGAILLISGRKSFGQTVPLGTFLTLGAAITFLYGKHLLKWYWQI